MVELPVELPRVEVQDELSQLARDRHLGHVREQIPSISSHSFELSHTI